MIVSAPVGSSGFAHGPARMAQNDRTILPYRNNRQTLPSQNLLTAQTLRRTLAICPLARFGVESRESRVESRESRAERPETRDQRPEARVQRPETRGKRQEARARVGGCHQKKLAAVFGRELCCILGFLRPGFGPAASDGVRRRQSSWTDAGIRLARVRSDFGRPCRAPNSGRSVDYALTNRPSRFAISVANRSIWPAAVSLLARWLRPPLVWTPI